MLNEDSQIKKVIVGKLFLRSFTLAGHNLPLEKTLLHSLTNIYGIGLSKSRSVLKKVNICFDTKILFIDYEKRKEIRNLVENGNVVEGRLRRRQKHAIERLFNTRTYRGRRHQKCLPIRGQRTRTNAKTAKIVSKKQVKTLKLQFGIKSSDSKGFKQKKRKIK